MTGFTPQQRLAPDASGYLTGIRDMEIVFTAGGPTLYLATDRNGGLSAYRIGADGRLSLSGHTPYAQSSSALASTALAVVPIQGVEALLPIGRYDQALTSYGLTADGALTGSSRSILSAPAPLQMETAPAATLVKAGAAYVYLAHPGASGPVGYHISGASSLAPVAATTGGAASSATITALGTVEAGGQAFVLAGLTGGGDRLVSYTVGSTGRLAQSHVLGPEQGLAIGTPEAIATAEVDGQSYAIVASAGSSSLSVVALGANGYMAATDQVVDDRNTRFAGADLVGAVEAAGHGFVLAAGADDGLSLFALTPGGRLIHVASVADAVDTTLANVSALSAVGGSSGIDVYAASASEPGLTAFHVDLSGFGDILEGGGGLLGGTARDDILIALDGADRLSGGAGADLFVFGTGGAASDGKLGTVLDYRPGLDRIDLSALPLLHDASQVSVEPTASGARLHFGGYYVDVHAAAPGPLTAADFSTASLLNATHQAVGEASDYQQNDQPSTPAGKVISGTGGNDNITGDLGNDSLSGGGGRDTIVGLDGNDTIHAGDGADRVLGGAGNDLIYGGDTSADGADTIDAGAGMNIVSGGWGDDRISAGADNDLLVGSEGNDWISAGNGQNTIRGGDGQDTLIGGAGADSIQAGDTAQDRFDLVFGAGGNDTIDGGYGNDSIYGGDGADSLDGGFGADTLIGNAGNDTLTGGPLSDLLFGGPGNDFLNGGYGNDRLNGGGGADRFYHLGTATHGADWVQDYDAAQGDVLVFGQGNATAQEFQVNFGTTPNAGSADVPEAFVVFTPTGQIVWALVDGAAAEQIDLQIAGDGTIHDLLG